MFKALRRILAIFAFVAVVLGLMKQFFDWIAQSEDDNHEVFDDEHEDVK
jgi:hypothetical protein